MQLLFLSITECFAAQAGWSLRRCTQLTWAEAGSGEVLSGRNVRVGDQLNSSSAARTVVVADGELKLLLAQFTRWTRRGCLVQRFVSICCPSLQGRASWSCQSLQDCIRPANFIRLVLLEMGLTTVSSKNPPEECWLNPSVMGRVDQRGPLNSRQTKGRLKGLTSVRGLWCD